MGVWTRIAMGRDQERNHNSDLHHLTHKTNSNKVWIHHIQIWRWTSGHQKAMPDPKPWSLSFAIRANLEPSLAEQLEEWTPLELSSTFCRLPLPKFDLKSINPTKGLLEKRFEVSPFVECIASRFEDEPAAAKKQCWILNPNPFASSSESENLEPVVLETAQSVRPRNAIQTQRYNNPQ